MLIVDAGQGAERIATELPGVERVLASMGLQFTVVRVEAAEQSSVAAREALLGGQRFIVAVGSDATVHHVVNGMLAEGMQAASDAVLGVISRGAPSDFVKTFGLPGDPVRAAAHLGGENLYPIDAGKVAYTADDGASAERYFVNVAEAGLGGTIAARAARLPRSLGRSRRFLAFWLSLAASRPATVMLSGDRRSWEGRVHNVLVANCQYYAGGVRISPRSWPADGYLDVLVMKGPRSDSFTILPKAYRGEHLPHPNIVEYRSRRLQIEADRPLRVEADGQVLGTTPVSFEVLPQAIRLKV
ncbi:MAG: diacylglycerol/lipid kinase family protein [Actinomycetota bacterium]